MGPRLGEWSSDGPDAERFGSGVGNRAKEAQGHTSWEPLDRHPGKSQAVNTFSDSAKANGKFGTIKGKVYNLY